MSEYNGELKALYTDIDKRLTTLEAVNSEKHRVHTQRAESLEVYIHESFHDVTTSLNNLNGKMDAMPCRERREHARGIDNNIKALWGAIVLIVGGAITAAYSVLTGGK